MRELLESLVRRLVPFESELDVPVASALAYVDRRLAAAGSSERDLFLERLAAFERDAVARHGRGFAELAEAEQCALLDALGAAAPASWPDARGWFAALVRWVAEAIYAEPGPARSRAWRALGYPELEQTPRRERPRLAGQACRDLGDPDVIVAGAGVSGCIVAGVLAQAGLRVLLLERGDDAHERAVERNHLENHRLSLYGHNTGPALDENPRVLIDGPSRRRVLRPHEPGYHNNAVGVGGGGLVFGAMAWRFHPDDFCMASRYGVPGESSLANWPIGYAELAPYYDRAESEIGVAGEPGARLGAAGERPYPMPAHEGHAGRACLVAGARSLGWRSHGVPLAINSVVRGGRSACLRCNACVGFACPVDAKNGGHNTLLRAGLASGRVVLHSEATVVSVDSDRTGRVIGVSYRRGRGAAATLEQPRARVVVVACGAIESARLLLDSPTPREPGGFGNGGDQVGRHLQGHVYVSATGLMPHAVEDGRGPGPSVAVSDFCHGNAGIVGGGLLSDDFVLLPIVAWNDHLPPGERRWGAHGGRLFQQSYRRLLKVMGPIQEIPNPNSRVTLDPDVKDGLGRRVARLSGTVHPESVRSAEFLRLRAEAWLRASGAERVWSTPFAHANFLSAGQHQSGTCRMGADAKSSVVDSWGRVHGHDNLYVIDASVHVTNGCVNPVLTVMALALRNAEALARVHAT